MYTSTNLSSDFIPVPMKSQSKGIQNIIPVVLCYKLKLKCNKNSKMPSNIKYMWKNGFCLWDEPWCSNNENLITTCEKVPCGQQSHWVAPHCSLFWVNGLKTNGRSMTPEPGQTPLGGSALTIISTKGLSESAESNNPKKWFVSWWFWSIAQSRMN